MTRTMSNLQIKIAEGPLKILFLAAIFASLWMFLVHFKSTAIAWPAADNLPAVCRLMNNNCLTKDFFTNASSASSPRYPYVYLLRIITELVTNGIGGGLAVIKSFLLIILPFTLTMIVATATRSNSNIRKDSIWLLVSLFAPIVIFLLQGRVGALLSVAWWMPLNFEATPQNVALSLTLIGYLFYYFDRRYASSLLIFIGGIIHPVMCLFASIFAYILYSNMFEYKQNRLMLGHCVLPSILAAIFIKLSFDIDAGLSTEEFVNIYVIESHASHYLPSQFGTFSELHWYVSYLLVIVGLLFSSVALYKLGSQAWKNSLIATCVYAISIIAQYVFVEIWPNKFVATLGPSRFTMFGPWFMFIFSMHAILAVLEKVKGLEKFSGLSQRIFNLIRWRYVLVGFAALCLYAALYTSKSYRFDFINAEDKKLFEFAQKTSSSSDVFILPFGEVRIYFPLITGRSIFFGNGFPFSEQFFREYQKREAMVNGINKVIKNIPGSWIGEKYSKYYQSLTPINFIEFAMSYQVDWVVVESNYSKSFLGCKADFVSDQYKVFSIHSLENCAK